MARALKDQKTGLTAKQEQFCLLYFETGNASAAYRAAYDAEKMAPKDVTNEAYRLLHNPDIAPMLEKLHHGLAERVMQGKKQHIGRLENLKRIALEAGEIGAAVKAEELIGKALGHYVEKVESGAPGDFSNLSDDELEQQRQAFSDAVALIERARRSPKPKVKVKASAKPEKA